MMIDERKLKAKILADRYNRIIFKEGKGRDLYLVGGYVRDVLRGKYSDDRDYIIHGNVNTFAKVIKKTIGGTIVRFKKGDVVRLALKEGVTMDFSGITGELKKDLKKRDFSINAIAWSPEHGLIDPYKGLRDLQEKIVRSFSKENFIADPLRMLRAYRFAAELNGSIEKKTRHSVKLLNNNIKFVSSERITLELFNLLNSDHSAKYLKMALSDGVLTSILCFPDKTLENNIKAISVVEKRTLKGLPPVIKVKLKGIFSQNLTYKGLLCLELLLYNNSSLEEKLPNIRMSEILRKRVELCCGGIKELRKNKKNLKSQLFDIFMRSKDAAADVVIISRRLDLLKDYSRFKRICKNGFLTSRDIIRISDVKTGPILGKLIMDSKKAQFEGRVKSKKSAITFLKQLLI